MHILKQVESDGVSKLVIEGAQMLERLDPTLAQGLMEWLEDGIHIACLHH
jgi:hypothetical protein